MLKDSVAPQTGLSMSSFRRLDILMELRKKEHPPMLEHLSKPDVRVLEES